MSFIGSMFDSSKGAGFNASGTPLVQPSTADQANQDYAQSQAALQGQAGMVAALNAQNGIGNQSQVYNQLQGVANGTGPNPAQAALNQNTANNISQQAALMGSQRGASNNPALLARQAAMQGGNIQQQAIGQAATNQANQSLNAINAAGNIANQQVTNQLNGNSAYNQAVQGNRGLTLNGIQGQNNANVGMQSNINSNNQAIAQGNQKFQQGVFSNLASGASGALGMLGGGSGGGGATALAGGQGEGMGGAATMLAAHGGVIPRMADGGEVDSGPSSSFGRSMIQDNSSLIPNPTSNVPMTQPAASSSGGGSGGSSIAQLAPLLMMAASRGGQVPTIVSPGEAYIPPANVRAVASGKADVRSAGEMIPGKAKVEGDSLKNDTVPKNLDAGGVVIPRSVMNSKDPASAAAKFVAAVVAKQGRGLPKKGK